MHEAERPGELGRSVLDGELAAATIGFRPETSLATGVAATWEWLQTQELNEGAGQRRANVVPWTYPFAPDRLVRPWRTAALVAVAVAAVELLILVVIGGALIAKPLDGRASGGKDRGSLEADAPREGCRELPHRAAAPAAHLARGKVTVLVLNGNGRQGQQRPRPPASRVTATASVTSRTRPAPTSRGAS